MPYREKIAWLSLFAIVVAFGPYFVIASMNTPSGMEDVPDLQFLLRYTLAAAAQLMILGVGHVLLRRTAPEDAGQPADERDRAIERRSMQIAYYVLMAGTVIVGMIMPFEAAGYEIVNAALAAIVLSMLVQHGLVVAGYRRSAA